MLLQFSGKILQRIIGYLRSYAEEGNQKLNVTEFATRFAVHGMGAPRDDEGNFSVGPDIWIAFGKSCDKHFRRVPHLQYLCGALGVDESLNESTESKKNRPKVAQKESHEELLRTKVKKLNIVAVEKEKELSVEENVEEVFKILEKGNLLNFFLAEQN